MRALIEVFTVMPFSENTYLIGDLDAGEAIVVDPGGRVDDILRVAQQHGLTIDRIVNTHAHIDHVSGVSDLQAATGASFWLHPEAEPMLAGVRQQAAMFGLPPFDPPTVDRHIQIGETIEVGGLRLESRFTPGHAPGHVTLVGPKIDYEGRQAPFALCGDAIFMGSIGRVDLPGGDYETLMRSIQQEILSLPDDTLLFSGHGPATTVGRERAYNPFVIEWLARGGG
jgi:glyoxylase-like metal-dependent hydrolase (beta-lactamase superfamily II)